ncbi:MAG: protein translocase subunit SecD, partial [Cyanobacteriota bacterium]
GTYMTLDVQLEKAGEAELIERIEQIETRLRADGKPVPVSKMFEPGKVMAKLAFATGQDTAVAYTYLLQIAPELKVSIEKRDEVTLALQLPKAIADQIGRDALLSNIRSLESRINKFGVGEVTIAQKGDRRIIIELPNVHNIEQAKSVIGKSALLEIKLVEDSAPTEQELLDKYGGAMPEGMMIVPGEKSEGRPTEFYMVSNYTDLTGKLLKTARAGIGGNLGAKPVVNFEFKPLGGERFYQLTSANIGRRIAIIIDGVVISDPVANTAIRSSGYIESARFTPEETEKLATMLSSGAFVAPVTFEEERHIGPSLGSEAINSGLLACTVGMAALIIFCLFFYKLAGLIAFIILIYNLLLSLVLLAMLHATLTLPGIAGILLTIGMAIDASILIYERMRDELAAGVPLRKAVDASFAGARAVIIDSNVTGFIVAVVLYI